MESKLKIKITNFENETETLWVTRVGENFFRIENSPFISYGISWKDIVEAIPDKDGVLKFIKIIKKSGHKTIRVLSESNPISDDFIKNLNSLGCSIEKATNRLIAVDIPEKVNLQRVVDELSNSIYKWEYVDPTYEEVNNLN